MNVEIIVLQPRDIDDFNQLLTVFDIVFEYEPYTRPDAAHLRKILANDAFCVIVAKLDDRVVAGLTAYILGQYHSVKPVFYIQDLAVLNEFQRKGIGRKLMSFAKAYCAENDLQEMYVQAEKIDNYAMDFYRTTQPTEEMQVVHFNYRI